MAIRIAMNVICDRCLKPYEQKNLEYGESVPEVKRQKLIVLREGDPDPKTGEVPQEVLLSYQDLCPQCEGVVEKAISRIKMDAPTTTKKKKRSGVKTTVKKDDVKEEEAEPTEGKAPEPEPEPHPKEDEPEEEEPLF